MTDKLPAKRGRGRPPGSKNKSTIARQAIAEQSLDVVLDNMVEVLLIVAQQAKDGCKVSQKLLIDKGMPTKTIQEISTAPDAEFKVTVTTVSKDPKVIEGEAIEAAVSGSIEDGVEL